MIDQKIQSYPDSRKNPHWLLAKIEQTKRELKERMPTKLSKKGNSLDY